MTNIYSKYLAERTNQITDILSTKDTVQEQETAIYELLKPISEECEIVI